MKRSLFTLLSLTLISLSLAAQFAPIANPNIPKSIKFAGDVVDLSSQDRRQRFDRELTSMIYTHGNTLLQMKRANAVFPVIKPILKRNGIPEDFVYLACIESYLNPRAVSSSKAAGVWQFMPTTAREYGLEVNDNVDERYDIELSTEAACKYLNNARSRFADWLTVGASYNAGMGRISKEVEAQGQKSALTLWLPDETMRYIFRLLAAKALMENAETFGYHLNKDQLYTPVDYRVIEVDTPIDDLAVWAIEHGTTYYDVRQHNPWIRSKSLPNKTGKIYKIRIPK
ncbi:MAG: lytic transglycosylase domain-containing protein [Muribaculaceae bacterium]|nr:lytic transglycosylase domain-containing protein [Muribaculaceae bacterium]